MIICIVDKNNKTIIKHTSEELYMLAIALFDGMTDSIINNYISLNIGQKRDTKGFFLFNIIEERLGMYSDPVNNMFTDEAEKQIFQSLYWKIENITEWECQILLRYLVEYIKFFDISSSHLELWLESKKLEKAKIKQCVWNEICLDINNCLNNDIRLGKGGTYAN